eukprot:TRINITY_DN4257_c2_g1_i1.p1 TRINITY_DN4257_c2_g1~~TRINITY_DN4257_c2_g1_i1.p1  ORF type:complete len:232 (+),score=62.77 TRINITY_DN4257_c2_g1_i1:76-771(+)
MPEPVTMGFGSFVWAFCKASWASTGVGASALVWYSLSDTGAQLVEKFTDEEETYTSLAVKDASDQESVEIRQSRVLRFGLYGFLTKYPKTYAFAVLRWALGGTVGPIGSVVLYDCLLVPGAAIGALAFTSKMHGDQSACAHVAKKWKSVTVAAIAIFLPYDVFMYTVAPAQAAGILAAIEYFAVRPVFLGYVAHQCALPSGAEPESPRLTRKSASPARQPAAEEKAEETAD